MVPRNVLYPTTDILSTTSDFKSIIFGNTTQLKEGILVFWRSQTTEPFSGTVFFLPQCAHKNLKAIETYSSVFILATCCWSTKRAVFWVQCPVH